VIGPLLCHPTGVCGAEGPRIFAPPACEELVGIVDEWEANQKEAS